MRALSGILNATVLIIGLAASSLGQESNRSVDVDALVERLASPERGERIAAERELLESGPSVLGRLPDENTISDPATRAAVVRIRKLLEDRRAEQQIEATRFVLRDVGTLGEAVQSIEQHYDSRRGEVFKLTPEQAAMRIALKPVERPFWEWVDQLAEELKLWPIEAERGKVAFRDRRPEDEAKRVASEKGFRIVSGGVELRTITGNVQKQLVRLPIEVRGEPKMRPLFLSYAADDFTLRSGPDVSLEPFTPNARLELPLGEWGQGVGFQLNFVALAGELAEPLTLEGKLTATVAAGQEDFAFPIGGEESRLGEESRGGVTVRLVDTSRKEDGTAEVGIAAVYGRGGPAFESYRTWVYHNLAYLETVVEEKGVETARRIEHEPEFETLAQSNGGVMLRYRFEGIPAEAKSLTFHYHAPTNIVDVPLEVEIGGLRVKAN